MESLKYNISRKFIYKNELSLQVPNILEGNYLVETNIQLTVMAKIIPIKSDFVEGLYAILCLFFFLFYISVQNTSIQSCCGFEVIVPTT